PTRRRAPSQSATSSPLATASPPAARIAATTSAAGPSARPLPSAAEPRSLTTTLAPSRPNSSACARPIPRPAPVTMTTRPSQIPFMAIDPALAQSFENGDVGLTAPFAHRLQPPTLAGALELAEERRHEARPRRAERVPERDGAAIHVDLGR